MKMKKTGWIAAAIAASLLASSAALAQWVMIGRKSMGVIQNLRSEHSDVASVLLESPANKVYSTTLAQLRARQGVRITASDEATRAVDFTSGRLAAKMQVSRVEENVSMLLISSPGGIRRSGSTTTVVDEVLRVCQEMGVSCRLADQ